VGRVSLSRILEGRVGGQAGSSVLAWGVGHADKVSLFFSFFSFFFFFNLIISFD